MPNDRGREAPFSCLQKTGEVLDAVENQTVLIEAGKRSCSRHSVIHYFMLASRPDFSTK